MTKKTIVFMDMEHLKLIKFSELFKICPSMFVVLTRVQAAFLRKSQSETVAANNRWYQQNRDKILAISGVKVEGKDFIVSCLSQLEESNVIILNRSIPLSSIEKEYKSREYSPKGNEVVAYTYIKPDGGIDYIYNRSGDPYVYPITKQVMVDEPELISL